jgi:hypothetical protein
MGNFCDQCNKELRAKEHCNICGVYNTGGNTTLYSLVSDALSQFISVEKGFIQTILSSFKNPRRLVLSYYEGYRNRFASPGKILIFTLIVLGLIYYFGEHKESTSITINDEEDLFDPLTSLKLTLLLLIPYLSISSKIVFYTKLNSWIIHIISMLYLFLPRLLLITVLLNTLPLFIKTIDSISFLLVLIMLISTFTANSRVFCDKIQFPKVVFLGLIQLIVFTGLILLTIALLSLLFVDWNFTFFS